jgi:electron transfer flavoprotein alpha subunit
MSFASAPSPSRSGAIVAPGGKVPASRIRIIERHKETGNQVRLEDAQVILAGGLGLNGPQGFNVLDDLARAPGAWWAQAACHAIWAGAPIPCRLG